MAAPRRRFARRMEANIWPGFVDAMTALVLVLMFVLSIFMIVQFVLRETISGQDKELEALSTRVASLADALGMERERSTGLETELGTLRGTLAETRTLASQQALMIDSLTEDRDTLAAERDALAGERDVQAARIADFEEQVAGLLSERADLGASLASRTEDVARLEEEKAAEIDRAEALSLALARLREEVDAQAEEARLAAARREALEALVASLRTDRAEQAGRIDTLSADLDAAREKQLADAAAAEALMARFSAEKAAEIGALEEKLSETEQLALAEQAAAAALRQRLADADAELTSMTLALEEKRREAEEALTMIAAAEAARNQAVTARADDLSELERNRALAAKANELLAQERAASVEDRKRLAVLNQQVLQLRRELAALQTTLDATQARDQERQVQVESLGSQLNTALAQVAEEQRRRAELEERERRRLEAEATDLRRARSEFFARTREILEDREGVEIVGDRFVFSSEVLFPVGSATLSRAGEEQIARVAAVIRDVMQEIPESVDWILRVDGHTDKTPLGGGRYADNWELSQARALSVVRYLIEDEDIPADRLSANGFGEFQPVDPGDSPEALARNRRIELKFTEQ